MNPTRERDDNGVLGAPRFVPELPKRLAGDTGRSSAVRALLPLIQQRPGQWAAVLELEKSHGCGNVVTGFKTGRYGPTKHWETAIRLNPETKRHVLYVRYIGPVKPGARP